MSPMPVTSERVLYRDRYLCQQFVGVAETAGDSAHLGRVEDGEMTAVEEGLAVERQRGVLDEEHYPRLRERRPPVGNRVAEAEMEQVRTARVAGAVSARPWVHA